MRDIAYYERENARLTAENKCQRERADELSDMYADMAAYGYQLSARCDTYRELLQTIHDQLDLNVGWGHLIIAIEQALKIGSVEE